MIFPVLWWAAAILLVGMWTVLAFLLHRGFRSERLIENLPPGESDQLPRLAVIVPALNEESTIEPAMRSLLAVEYPQIRVFAVNDRSTDSTGEILDRLAAANPRLNVIRTKELPEGWLGKCHALHVGASRVDEPWILFTDADVNFAPDSVRRAVHYAVTQDLDHLVVFPKVILQGFWESLFVSFFGVIFCAKFRPWEIENPRSGAYVGVGAFNLVRTSTYQRVGGHTALRMEVADDVKLGKLIKRSGGRSGVLASESLIRLRWISGLGGAIHGLTKNMFAGLDFSLTKALVSSAALYVLTSGPLIGTACSPTQCKPVYLAAWLVMSAAASSPVLSRRNAGLIGLAYPIAGIILIYTILRSMWITYRQNGVVWRGTHYSLDELRKGLT